MMILGSSSPHTLFLPYMYVSGSKDAIPNLQGLPSGFDLMYLALADRNMQVRFGLKVVGDS
jgi:hypothetical protein